MKRIQFSLLIMLCLIGSSHSYGQTSAFDTKPNDIYVQQKQIANDITAKSGLMPIKLPDANSLISMNESGDGIITLPIVNVKGRKLTLPVNITYVTSGIKADQSASEVGLGWNINIGSITRDYGAYEPDYTYTGSEFPMANDDYHAYDQKFKSPSWGYNATTSSYMQIGTHTYTPGNQNKILEYNNVTGMAPDNYVLSIPGLGANDFWNNAEAGSASPNFIFTEKVPWKISMQKDSIKISQEVSRINEFTFADDPSGNLLQDHNIAAAIALYPYVINQQYSELVESAPSGCVSPTTLMGIGSLKSPYMQVSYQDYTKFVVTTSDGTTYIFGRPLRGQKYLFNEEPFWSAVATPFYLLTGAVDQMKYNEWWKTDYIAEWLLTEIHSNDYIDVNANGIADDADKGDWIKIEYTTPILFENIPGLALAIAEPKHREFLNFTQTDRASSIWRERAYVTKITTPVQALEFSCSERFDVNHDYFKAPFNRIDNEYKYNDKYIPGGGISISDIDPTTGLPLDPEIIDHNTIVNYPSQLMKYDLVTVRENVISSNLVQNVSLKYAVKGSSEELAVSDKLIIDNMKNFTAYDPSGLGSGLSENNFSKEIGRGKTTLIGIEYKGSDLASTNKVAYSFNYGYNPSFSNIHMHEIWRQAAFPSIREALRSPTQRWTGIRSFVIPPSTVFNIPNSILPWKTVRLDNSIGLPFGSSGIHFLFGQNNDNPVYEDELGYFFDNSAPNKGRDAWSLTRINLPYGGNVTIDYERDQTDIYNDRRAWQIPDYCLPEVGHYNNVAHLRSILQHNYNINFPLTSAYSSVWGNNMIKLYSEYYYAMDENSGGLRIKNIYINDNFGAPTVKKSYSYGTGHYTAPPADYWDNYAKGFGEFLYNEYKRHGNSDAEGVETYSSTGLAGADFSEYEATMMGITLNLRIDNSYRRNAKHYYEYIDEVYNDGSKKRMLYGKLDVVATGGEPPERRCYLDMEYGVIKGTINDWHNVVTVLSGTVYPGKPEIGNYSTLYYNSVGQIVKESANDFALTNSYHNAINVNDQILHAQPFPVYLADVLDGLGLVPTTSTVFYPSSNMYLLYNDLDISLQSVMGYATTASMGPGTAFGIAEAQNTLLKIGVQSGLYTGMPAWFSSISAQPKKWAITHTDSWVNTQLASYIDYVIALSMSGTFSGLPFHHIYFSDINFELPSTVFYNQKSSSVVNTHTQTVTNFY